jgi:hypothetical protein
MSKNNIQQAISPAFPTFPVQNQFGQPVMFTGLVKLEIIALQMLNHTITHFQHPEDAMKEAIKMAQDFLNVVDQYIEDNTKESSTPIIELPK